MSATPPPQHQAAWHDLKIQTGMATPTQYGTPGSGGSSISSLQSFPTPYGYSNGISSVQATTVHTNAHMHSHSHAALTHATHAHMHTHSQPAYVQAVSAPLYSGVMYKSQPHSRVKNACVNCKQAKTKCEAKRPCKRCIDKGLAASCRDVKHKQRGKKRKHPSLKVETGREAGGVKMPPAKTPKTPKTAPLRPASGTQDMMSINCKRGNASPNFNGVYTYGQPTNFNHALTPTRTSRGLHTQAAASDVPFSVTYIKHLQNSLAREAKKHWNPSSNNPALQWILNCSQAQAEALDIKSQPTLLEDLQNSDFQQEMATLDTLPLGAMLVCLVPIPFHPANRVWLNPKACEALGYSDADITSMNQNDKAFALLFHISNLETAAKHFVEALVTGKTNYTIETRWITKQGVIVTAQENVHIRFHEKEGRQVPLYCTSFIQGWQVGEPSAVPAMPVMQPTPAVAVAVHQPMTMSRAASQPMTTQAISVATVGTLPPTTQTTQPQPTTSMAPAVSSAEQSQTKQTRPKETKTDFQPLIDDDSDTAGLSPTGGLSHEMRDMSLEFPVGDIPDSDDAKGGETPASSTTAGYMMDIEGDNPFEMSMLPFGGDLSESLSFGGLSYASTADSLESVYNMS